MAQKFRTLKLIGGPEPRSWSLIDAESGEPIAGATKLELLWDGNELPDTRVRVVLTLTQFEVDMSLRVSEVEETRRIIVPWPDGAGL